jgi:hypothetical protein
VKFLAAAILSATAIAQSPPFSYYQNLTTSPRLGYIAAAQLGNLSTQVNSGAWCEQDTYAYTPAGTATATASYGWQPTIGHQIVLVSEGYRCQPFPPFQAYFPAGTYVPVFGVSFTNFGVHPPIYGADPNWNLLHLDAASASFFLPPYQRIEQFSIPPHDLFFATIDVPNDPQLVGTVLWVQSFRNDPFLSSWFASRCLGLWLQP